MMRTLSRSAPTQARLFTVVAIFATLAPLSAAQSFQERIDRVRAMRAAQADAEAVETSSIRARLMRSIDEIDLEQVDARNALQWWSRQTGVPLVIDWEAMAADGVDADATLTIRLRQVPALRVLEILLTQVNGANQFSGADLIVESTRWYVQIQTKSQANRNPIARVYDVRDLLMDIPNFNNAPSFDLSSALSGQGSGSGGGGGGGSGGDLFEQDEEDEEPKLSARERGEQIAQLIRDSIEPDIWAANGGEWAAITYYNGRLIVRAPAYVQRQIGGPSVRVFDRAPRVARRTRATGDHPDRPTRSRSGGGVGGVGDVSRPPGGVSGRR